MTKHQDEVTSLSGPVESIDGHLTLRIPLSAGGDKLIPCARGIGTVEAEVLCLQIPGWLAEQLNIVEGCCVVVDNAGGRLNIRRDSAA